MQPVRLPTSFRRRAEAFFGADFSTVLVHQVSRAECLGHAALTCGEDIYLAEQGLDVERPRVQRILIHELTHVLQQRAGRVGRTQPGEVLVVEPLLELEAEQAAERWMWAESSAWTSGCPWNGASRAVGERFPHAVAQPYLELQVSSRPKKQVEDAARIYEETNDYLMTTDDRALAGNWRNKAKKSAILEVLGYWISAPRARNTERADRNIALTRIYSRYEDLARAVLCQVDANYFTSDIENMMAREVMKSVQVRDLLLAFIQEKLTPWMEGKHSLRLKIETGKGRYLAYVVAKKQQSLAAILKTPGEEPLGSLISAIHDVTDVLWNDEAEGKEIVKIPETKFKGLVYNEDEHRYVPQEIKQGFRGEGATAVVTHEQVSAGMRLGFSLCLGPSNTTGRMLMLAEACEASTEQKEAIAWAIFAFWNVEYRRDLTEIHGFHHVMDMANNFGVPYDPTALPKPPLGPLTDKFPQMVKEVRDAVKKRELERRRPAPTVQVQPQAQPQAPSRESLLDSCILQTLEAFNGPSMGVEYRRAPKLATVFGQAIAMTPTEYEQAVTRLLEQKKIGAKSAKGRLFKL